MATANTPTMKQSFGAALTGNWERMSDCYKCETSGHEYPPFTPDGDTALHISVYSEKEQPLKDLLRILEDNHGPDFGMCGNDVLKKRNDYGNNVLHEAAIAGNLEAVKLLVERCPELVTAKNNYGETPLFTAAGFLEDKAIVEYLIREQPKLIKDPNGRELLPVHRQRDDQTIDGASILHVAIHGQHFETALLLLEVDESLHDINSKSGITALALLATMPSAFKSVSGPMGIINSLFYCCLPVKQQKTRKYGRQQQDLESGQGRSRGGLLDSYFPRASQMASTLTSCILCPLAWLGKWTRLADLWQQKRNHVFALRLARCLIKKEKWDTHGSGTGGNMFTNPSLIETSAEAAQSSSAAQQTDHIKSLQGGASNTGKETQILINTTREEDEITIKTSVVAVNSSNPAQHNDHIRNGTSGNMSSTPPLNEAAAAKSSSAAHQTDHSKSSQEGASNTRNEEQISIRKQQEIAKETSGKEDENALFKAAENGIEEIVFEILAEHPQAVWYHNKAGNSILDVAVIYRQKRIFNLVKKLRTPMHRMKRVIDHNKNTLLHHVANIDHYTGGTKPGPALQLQEELIWFERVRMEIPPHYVILRNNKNKTAKELFDEKHGDQLKKAQKWIKETAQSCSTVAALVATVVFAAIYTVPGGANDKGIPNFISSRYFLIFTVSDVVSLASSLISLVVFLSVLTSPCGINDFLASLPRRLKIGLTFLFFSVITTMIAFGSTILILIQSQKKLTTLLISVAAFLPVLVFAMMQFNMYTALLGSARKIIPKKIRRVFSPGWEKKLERKLMKNLARRNPMPNRLNSITNHISNGIRHRKIPPLIG